MGRKLQPVHPGEVLLEEFLKPLGISQQRLAREISVSPSRVYKTVRGKASLTAELALRLGRYFRMSAEFWLNLQSHYDLERAKDKLERRLRAEVAVHAA